MTCSHGSGIQWNAELCGVCIQTWSSMYHARQPRPEQTKSRTVTRSVSIPSLPPSSSTVQANLRPTNGYQRETPGTW